MDPISKSLYPINDENNSSTQNWSQDPDLTDQNQVPLSTTAIQSVSDDDNQPIVEQPFKKPKLINVVGLFCFKNFVFDIRLNNLQHVPVIFSLVR